MTPVTDVSPDPPTRWDLFSAFLKIGVIGFGGVAAFARHVLVTERGLMSDRDFAESFGVASTMPGANTVNLASMLGDRWRGPSGALCAVLGLMGAPLAILIAIMTVYSRVADLPDVKAALTGAAAAAAGLVVGTSLKLMWALGPDAAKILVFAAVCLATVLRAPMLLVLMLAIPSSLALAFLRRRRP